MKKISNTTKASPSKATGKPTAIRRDRQTGIPDRIISLLAAGPMRAGELQKKGGFTGSALHRNINKLKAAGVVVSHKEGQAVTLSLKGKGKTTEKSKPAPIEGELVDDVQAKKSSNSTAIAKTALGPELDAALRAVAQRLHPVQGIEKKLGVLDQLARTLPSSIAKVLHAIMQDLATFS